MTPKRQEVVFLCSLALSVGVMGIYVSIKLEDKYLTLLCATIFTLSSLYLFREALRTE